MKTSNPFQNCLKTIHCYEFIDRFEELWLLSKESLGQGLIDEEAEKWVKRTKKIPVDKQLLTDFTRFREQLSKNIMKLNQNKNLTEEELDESVQRILDRLIFIRNCEDRELEEKKLWEAKNERRVWKKVKELFAYYDKNYNSKLFTYDPQDPKNVHLCDTLDIDDEVLEGILESLYQTKDRAISYDFSAIEADVLGNIYEQYLGHILKKSEKRAKLKESHARRKEQGIYYTPTYIVDYIVRNTLGELLKDKKVNVERIRILDPACGSGSFLIKAFDVLKEHYIKNAKDYYQPQLDFASDAPFTTKVKILKNNIFGVDLDRQAAIDKTNAVANKLEAMKLKRAAQMVREAAHETLVYMSFPREYWIRIRTNNPLERIIREIRRRTRVVGCFPDGQSALMLVAARLRYIASTKWAERKYLNIRRLKDMNSENVASA